MCRKIQFCLILGKPRGSAQSKCKVTLYEKCGSNLKKKGSTIKLATGIYTESDLAAKGVPANKVTGMKIEGDCMVELLKSGVWANKNIQVIWTSKDPQFMGGKCHDIKTMALTKSLRVRPSTCFIHVFSVCLLLSVP